MSRVLYFLQSKAQFPAHSPTIDALIEQGADVRIYFDPTWTASSAGMTDALEAWSARNPDVQISDFPIKPHRWRGAVQFARRLRRHHALSRPASQSPARGEGWLTSLMADPGLPGWMTSPPFSSPAVLSWAAAAAEVIERLATPANDFTAWLQRKAASIVVVSPGNSPAGEEAEIVKAAKLLGIKTVVAVQSWEGLRLSGPIQFRPDLLLVWNRIQKRQAETLHGMDPERIKLAGAPPFDRWRTPLQAGAREDFCTSVGLDPARPYLAYVGSSRSVIADEAHILRKLRAALDGHADAAIRRIQILVLPHPTGGEDLSSVQSPGVAVLQRDKLSAATDEKITACFQHAACVMAVNTRGLLDAVACDRPAIALQIEGRSELLAPIHGLDWMVGKGAVYCAATPGKAVALLASALDLDPASKSRREFAHTFIWPRGWGGEAQAREILGLLTKKQRRGLERLRQEMQEAQPPSSNEDAPAWSPRHSPPASVAAEIQAIRLQSRDRRHALAEASLYTSYCDLSRRLSPRQQTGMDAAPPSNAEPDQDVWNASPQVVENWREHSHLVGGERSYGCGRRPDTEAWQARLEALSAADPSDLFVAEPAALGGFGWRTDRGLVNRESVQLYETMIGLDRSGLLEPFKRDPAQRRLVVLLGAGWGGLIHRFKSRFPNTTWIAIDRPDALLYAGVYLRGVFPDASIAVLDRKTGASTLDGWRDHDLLLAPAQSLSALTPPCPDLAIDLSSQMGERAHLFDLLIDDWNRLLERTGCRGLYRSVPANPEGELESLPRRLYDLRPIIILEAESAQVEAGHCRAPAVHSLASEDRSLSAARVEYRAEQ